MYYETGKFNFDIKMLIELRKKQAEEVAERSCPRIINVTVFEGNELKARRLINSIIAKIVAAGLEPDFTFDEMTVLNDLKQPSILSLDIESMH